MTIYCLMVLGASLAGGWLPVLLRLTHARLQVAVSLVSGLMLGLSLLHLLPHGAEELGSTVQATAWMMAGFLAMFFLQRFLPVHHHEVEETEEECGHEHHDHESHAVVLAARPLSWMAVAVGLSIHSVFDGLALAAAVVSSKHGHGAGLGAGTAMAVILHKPLCAMAITTLIHVGGASRRWFHAVNILFALVTPIGASLFFLGAGQNVEAHPAWLGAALAFSSGTFLCIACADLLPELQFHSHDRLKLSIALVAGLGLAILIGRAGHPTHECAPGHDHDPAPATGAMNSGQPGFLMPQIRNSTWCNSRHAYPTGHPQA